MKIPLKTFSSRPSSAYRDQNTFAPAAKVSPLSSRRFASQKPSQRYSEMFRAAKQERSLFLQISRKNISSERKGVVIGKKQNDGFTIAELLVSAGLFVIVITILSVSFIRTLAAERRTIALLAINNNASIAMEQIMRELRTAIDFCTTGPCSGGEINFINAKGESVHYAHENSAMVRAVGGGENKAITSPDVVVSDALFGAFHPDKNDGEQVRIVVRLVIGSAAAEMQGVSTILQTSVTPRVLNQ